MKEFLILASAAGCEGTPTHAALSALRACLPELDIEAGTEIGVALNAVV